MKLEKFGLNGYNLRNIDLVYADKKGQILKIIPSRDNEGALLKSFKQIGAEYYDKPFFHKGVALSVALMISHRIFSQNKDFLLVSAHLGQSVFNVKPIEFFFSQFYAAVIPFFFSLMLMILTFYLGKILFSNKIGLYASFMIIANPISILTAHKIWSDDMLSAFVTLSVILFLLSQRREKTWISFLGGVSCGIAVLTKQNGGIIFAAILLYHLFTKLNNIKNWPSFIFDKYLISYGMGLVVISAPWFYKVYTIYGNPLYLPPKPDILNTDTTEWFSILRSRPHPLKLFAIGIPYLSPVFVFAFGTLKNLITCIFAPFKKRGIQENAILLLWLWILLFVLFFVFWGGGKEHRRMLPAYPAISVLAACALSKLKIFVERISKNKIVAEVLIIAILAISACWSVPMGISAVIENEALILKPF